MLREMGCNVVRTSHNMPAEALVELCDEMGLMLMIEPFDEWEVAKCRNGYLRYFAEWAERDLVNMVHHFRNTLSVVMWSVGDEVPTQSTAAGYRTASWLQSICHREDPTRPVTCGMDQVDDVLSNGFAAIFGIPGQLPGAPLPRSLRPSAAEHPAWLRNRLDGLVARRLPLPGRSGP